MKFITLRAVTRAIPVSTWYLKQIIKRGDIDAYVFPNGRYYIELGDLNKWIKNNCVDVKPHKKG